MISPDIINRHGVDSIPNMSKKLMQFTGLHDKNGKEIYEGDIVLEGITRKIIVWSNGSFHIQAPNYELNKDLPTRPLSEGIRFEVIGNIYENPELIEP